MNRDDQRQHSSADEGSAAIISQPGRDFLSGGGRMGRLIRDFDWSRNELGPPEHWPQSLRTVVRLMLTTNYPAYIFWGPSLIGLYNDAYSASLGPEKHPAILGMRGRKAWDEIWPIIAPDIDYVTQGKGATWHENALVPIIRHGRREDVYWTYSYSPIDDEGAPNGIGGVLVLCTETTAQVLSERRQAFVVRLSDSLRSIGDPKGVMRAAARALAEHLDVDCGGFTEFVEGGEVGVVSDVYNRAGLPGIEGLHRADDYGVRMKAALQTGELVRIDDVAQSPLTSQAAGFARLGIGAIVQVPMLDNGELKGSFWVLSVTPRPWRDEEVELVREIGLRLLAEVERARAERALRDNEALLRAIGQSSAELIYAKDRDHRVIYANPATLDVIGRPADQVFGRTEADWHDNPEQAEAIMANDRWVMAKGETLSIEERFTTPGQTERIMHSVKAPLRDDAGTIIGIVGVTSDVTERHRDQQHLKLLVDELNHRVKNMLAIIQSVAHQTFRGDGIQGAAREAFEGRLEALATAHNLLTRERWEVTDLAAIVSEICASHDESGRFDVSGPHVAIEPKSAVTIGMALHELATNATKYGALSVAGGTVEVHWSIEGEGEGDRLRLVWREIGGPAVSAPSQRGFGSRMIERALAAELRGHVALDFAPAGLVCTMDAPLPRTPKGSA